MDDGQTNGFDNCQTNDFDYQAPNDIIHLEAVPDAIISLEQHHHHHHHHQNPHETRMIAAQMAAVQMQRNRMAMAGPFGAPRPGFGPAHGPPMHYPSGGGHGMHPGPGAFHGGHPMGMRHPAAGFPGACRPFFR